MRLFRNLPAIPLVVSLIALTACSSASPTNPATLALSATAITRVDSGGQVVLKKVGVIWGNLPGNTGNVDLERQPAGGQRQKLGTFPRSTTTYSDTAVDLRADYSYFVTAFDSNNSPIGSASIAGVAVFSSDNVGAPAITAPASGASVSRSQGLTATWQAASGNPAFYYVRVVNSGTQKEVAGLVVPGNTTTANIATFAPTNPTQSIVSNGDSIPNLKDILSITTDKGFDSGASYQVTVSAIASDNAGDLTQARSVAIRDSATVSFSVP